MREITTTLEHRILVPESSGAVMHPTMIMLHGRGADEEDLIGLAGHYDPRFLVLSVRAPYPFSLGGGYTWYDVGKIGTPDPAMFRMSYDRLSRFLDDALHGYPVDPSQVFLFGFSMGTVMAFALSLTRPELFRGVIANSGYVPEGTHLTLRWREIGNLAFFIAHGTEDPVIPIDFARRAKQLFEESDARVTYREYAMGHQISEESVRDSALFLRGLSGPATGLR
ncbi:MAG TPA: alpha/beta hydrolase-fold protein [Bacteroidota bacterium]|nr:alpha/beta hydrolase-fold protein [Bacteroidota bacterium]